MKEIRVLHITPWYPHDDDPSRTVYIRRQIDALAPFVSQHILHLDMDNRQYAEKSDETITISRVKPLFNFWRWKEWAFYCELKKQLILLDAANQFTHVNFHIAYPSLVFFDGIKQLLPPKICITEHWSIYHYHFFSKTRPHRLSRMFQHAIPIAAVSESLKRDLIDFSGMDLQVSILPNVVDTSVFKYAEMPVGEHYFMAALWKLPKNPMHVLQAILDLRKDNTLVKLRIAGDGPLLFSMKQFVADNHLEDQIVFVGKLSPENLALELNLARALFMPTHYETFGVITAEALACGCPVIADGTGALPELLNHDNGILKEYDAHWSEAIAAFESAAFDRKRIAIEASSKFNASQIGQHYLRFLQEL